MKRDDKISVLICVHSQDQFHDDLLHGALSSLENQSFRDFETVVVLDECWEHTELMLSDFVEDLNITYWERDKKEGLAKAKNFGLQHCTGDWIAFLDADDEYMPCKMEFQRQFLINNPTIDVCGTLAWDRIGTHMEPSCFKPGQYETHAQIQAKLPRENIMCHGSLMIRRTALDAVGGYETGKDMLGKEDWATWMKLMQGNYTFHNIPERLYVWTANTSVPR
jgi:glycosyltransferase involved in cell wall biosynthesis